MNAKSQLEPKRAAPPPLWRALRRFLLTIFALFGEPQNIAAQGVMRRKQFALMVPWLRAGEAFLRRLLFIEALAVIGSAPAPKVSARTTRKPRVRKLVYFHPDRPEDWRVSFRLFEPTRTPRTRVRARRVQHDPILLPGAFRPAPAPQRQNTHDTSPVDRRIDTTPAPASVAAARQLRSLWPLAERFEAMLRTFNDPQSSAHRLARALQRNADCAERALRTQPRYIANLFGSYFDPCDRIAEKQRKSWSRPPAAPDTG